MDYLEFFSIFYYFLFLKVTVHPYPVSCQGTPDIFTSWWRRFANKLLILLKFEFSTPKLLRMQNFRFLVVLVTELLRLCWIWDPQACDVILGVWRLHSDMWSSFPKRIDLQKTLCKFLWKLGHSTRKYAFFFKHISSAFV